MTIIHDITGTAGFKVSLMHADAIAVRNCMRCGTFEVIHAWKKTNKQTKNTVLSFLLHTLSSLPPPHLHLPLSSPPTLGG